MTSLDLRWSAPKRGCFWVNRNMPIAKLWDALLQDYFYSYGS
jgi:hypothetical protein